MKKHFQDQVLVTQPLEGLHLDQEAFSGANSSVLRAWWVLFPWGLMREKVKVSVES